MMERACAEHADKFVCDTALETGAVGTPVPGTDAAAVQEAFGGAQLGADMLLVESGEGILHTERSKWEPNFAIPSVASLSGRGLTQSEATNRAPEADETNRPYHLRFLREGARRECAESLNAECKEPAVSPNADDDLEAGSGVTVYIVTGSAADPRHDDWPGTSRGSVETSFGPANANSSICATWQGTHIAGLVNGAIHGVAPGARVVIVSASPGCRRPIWMRDYVRALQWVVDDRRAVLRDRVLAPPPAVLVTVPTVPIKRRDIVAVSLLEDLVSVLTDDLRVTAVAAAGDSGDDACEFAPGRMRDVITVAALEVFADARNTTMARPWTQTNFGSCVNAWAQGALVESAQPTARDAAAVYSGTAQAAAITAGAAARFLGQDPGASSAEVRSALTDDLAARDTLLYTRPRTTRAVVQIADPAT